ncbi:hypothetical protein DFP72DRAFT_911611 [Ephemerocybe angulata]|uniref:Uncharacterized protein n=1 Tax=Ephemerocybe angulata TaxID=980116 RepID=A0A8H6HPL6_9AGAR|nr:hypothetical protein DFP72DRAFT_911611 [Tulosesus angulatus]
MSYSDLLTSTPASTHTLSSLTTSASTIEPSPHIPGVSGLNLVSSVASASPSLRGFSTSPGKRDSVALLISLGVSGKGRGWARVWWRGWRVRRYATTTTDYDDYGKTAMGGRRR